MRRFVFFNLFTTMDGGVGHGHFPVTLQEGQKVTHDLILEVERQVRTQEGYRALAVTGFAELEA